jgi:nitroreductase
MLATQNILLSAHSLGLGSCLIGMAVEAMKHEPKIQRSLHIPDTEAVYAIIALGYSRETYQRQTGRKQAAIRFFEGSS